MAGALDGIKVIDLAILVQAPPVAPEIGQHTEEVLLELGLSWEEIAALGDAGAI